MNWERVQKKIDNGIFYWSLDLSIDPLKRKNEKRKMIYIFNGENNVQYKATALKSVVSFRVICQCSFRPKSFPTNFALIRGCFWFEKLLSVLQVRTKHILHCSESWARLEVVLVVASSTSFCSRSDGGTSMNFLVRIWWAIGEVTACIAISRISS